MSGKQTVLDVSALTGTRKTSVHIESRVHCAGQNTDLKISNQDFSWNVEEKINFIGRYENNKHGEGDAQLIDIGEHKYPHTKKKGFRLPAIQCRDIRELKLSKDFDRQRQTKISAVITGRIQI